MSNWRVSKDFLDLEHDPKSKPEPELSTLQLSNQPLQTLDAAIPQPQDKGGSSAPQKQPDIDQP